MIRSVLSEALSSAEIVKRELHLGHRGDLSWPLHIYFRDATPARLFKLIGIASEMPHVTSFEKIRIVIFHELKFIINIIYRL